METIQMKTIQQSGTALCAALILALASVLGEAHAAPSAAARMNELGPDNSQLARRAGAWDVVETVWATPGAAPTSTHAFAERRMIGSFLQEMLKPAPGSANVLRIDYLSFNRVEGRWKYVSMETRAPVGMMTAQSFGRGEQGRIDITFQPFALPGSGTIVAGQLLQMNQRIILQDSNHDRKDQYFVLADGNGKTWLAHRYAYTRRQAGSK